MNAIRRSIADVLANSDRCSLKRLAWAYGCAAKGSDLERQLEAALRKRCADDAAMAEIDADPVAALCRLVHEAGGVMKFHGIPISAEDLRGAASRHAKDRMLARLAPPLVPGLQNEEHW